LAIWLALAGMVSALALFNALLLAYSRIPLAMAGDGLLPRPLAATDARGTPANAVLVSAIFYSLFALVSFSGLVVADVLLYAMALLLEFGSLIILRRREPALRGAYRIPLGLRGVTVLAVVPAIVLIIIVGLSLQDPEYGTPAIVSALLGAGLGPPAYWLARRLKPPPLAEPPSD